MTAVISSTANDRVKRWISLGKRSVRDRTGRFFVEGRREVERIASFAALDELILGHDTSLDDDSPLLRTQAVRVSDHVFSRLSRRQNPDGVAGVFTTPLHDLAAIDPGTDALILVADGIEKPGNIGAMVRTADALGASFIGSSLGTDLVNPNVIRAAQGSLFATPTAVGARDEVISWCTGKAQTIVLRPDDSVSVWSVDLTVPTAIVVGAEADGVGAAWNEVGIGAVIPMSGSADSLNASVSAAIVLAEAVRQRTTAVSTT